MYRLLCIFILSIAALAAVSCSQPIQGNEFPDPITVPDVSSVKATPGNTRAMLAWVEPTSAEFTGVELSLSTGGTVVLAKGTNTYAWTGLTNSPATPYSVTIKSIDQSGNRSTGVTATVSPVAGAGGTAPGVVTRFAAHPGEDSTLVEWVNPTTSTAIGHAYTQLTVDSGTPINIPVPLTSIELRGLGTSTVHSFTLRTVNVAGSTSAVVGPFTDDLSTAGGGAWVLAYFRNGGDTTTNTQAAAASTLPAGYYSDSLYLAYSTDALTWKTINSVAASSSHSKEIYTIPSSVGPSGAGNRHIRDPYITRKRDGTFVYLATDWTVWPGSGSYWSFPSSYLVTATTTNLYSYSWPRRLLMSTILGPNFGSMHAWAPEVIYDATRGKYGVIWSGNAADNVNRTYINYTRDFISFDSATPQVFFDPGWSQIDASIYPYNNKYYLIFKDERNLTDAGNTGKDLQMAVSDSLEPGSFTVMFGGKYLNRLAAQTTRIKAEGGFIVKDPVLAKWYIYADLYEYPGAPQYDGWSTTDLEADPASGAWQDMTPLPGTHFPITPRHGNPLRVTLAELNALKAVYAPNNQ